jgi:eukaryotic-like serine/threonine-protein kinase
MNEDRIRRRDDSGGTTAPGPGHVVAGRYELVAPLRAGRFGDFWRAMRLPERAPVVVKLIRTDLFEDEKSVARFERETRLLAAFDHPNLLKVLEHGVADGAPWIATEPHDGQVLGDLVGELSLTLEAIADIGMQLALVLAAAHERGIIHRGLDPDSILLVQQRPLRVAIHDFGLAHQAEGKSVQQQTTLTGADERLGRVEYWAPEYVSDHALDARTDLYALGILLFEMATGQPPFVGSSLAVMNKHVTTPAPAPSSLTESPLPAWFDALVTALLAKAPADRPATAAIVAQALRERRWPPDNGPADSRRKKTTSPPRRR